MNIKEPITIGPINIVFEPQLHRWHYVSGGYEIVINFVNHIDDRTALKNKEAARYCDARLSITKDGCEIINAMIKSVDTNPQVANMIANLMTQYLDATQSFESACKDF